VSFLVDWSVRWMEVLSLIKLSSFESWSSMSLKCKLSVSLHFNYGLHFVLLSCCFRLTWDLMFSRRWRFKLWSFELWRRVILWKDNKVSDHLAASILLVVTPCNVVVGYQRFGWTCCLHLLGCDAVERWATVHCVTTQKTSTLIPSPFSSIQNCLPLLCLISLLLVQHSGQRCTLLLSSQYSSVCGA